jgi:hypothetical protein
MPIFNAKDIVGKTLIAKKKVFLYSSPTAKNPLASINPGQTIGVVYSYLKPGKNRPQLWWMFQNGARFVYVAHQEGSFDVQSLKDQGIKSTEERTKEEAEKLEKQQKGAVSFYIEKYVPWIIVGIFAVPLIKDLIKK